MATRHERRRTMQRLLRSWEQSGERVHAFCAKRNIPVSTFFWWKLRLRSEPVTVQDTPHSAFPAFVPMGSLPTSSRFEYRFPDGGSLALPGSLGLADVAALIRQLREGRT